MLSICRIVHFRLHWNEKISQNEIRDYLEGIYNTIVVKDIINRKKITDTMMLKSVLRFVFDSIGNPLSSKKLQIR